MNLRAIRAIYTYEIARSLRTLVQTLAAPVVTTALYFIVFASVIGARMAPIEQVNYSAYIVPGLVMLNILSTSVSNASFGFYMPRFAGTIFEVLSAPVSVFEIVAGYVLAAATKSVVIGLVILLTARLFVDYHIAQPVLMFLFLVLTAVTFSLAGFLIATVANGWEKLEIVPLFVLTPLVFLGGTFYSIDMLDPLWRSVTLFNPVLYLVSGFRWTFFQVSDVNIWISLAAILGFMLICLGLIAWMFRHSPSLRP